MDTMMAMTKKELNAKKMQWTKWEWMKNKRNELATTFHLFSFSKILTFLGSCCCRIMGGTHPSHATLSPFSVHDLNEYRCEFCLTEQRAIPAILANANIIILCRCFCALYLKKIVDNNNSINQCYCSYCYFVSTSLLWLLAIRQTLLCFLVIFSSVLFCVCTRTYANVCVTDSQWQWYLY